MKGEAMFANGPSVRLLRRWLAAALAAAAAFNAAPSHGADEIPAATFFANAEIREIPVTCSRSTRVERNWPNTT